MCLKSFIFRQEVQNVKTESNVHTNITAETVQINTTGKNDEHDMISS